MNNDKNDKCKCGCDFHPGIPCEEAMAFEGRGPYYERMAKSNVPKPGNKTKGKEMKKAKTVKATTPSQKFLSSLQRKIDSGLSYSEANEYMETIVAKFKGSDEQEQHEAFKAKHGIWPSTGFRRIERNF